MNNVHFCEVSLCVEFVCMLSRMGVLMVYCCTVLYLLADVANTGAVQSCATKPHLMIVSLMANRAIAVRRCTGPRIEAPDVFVSAPPGSETSAIVRP